MSAARLNEESFAAAVHHGDRPVVVDFYADWCGPCHQLAPIIERLSERYEGHVLFAKVNVDDEPEIAATYQIRSIPAVILFDGGEPRARSVGVRPPQMLADELGLDTYADAASRSLEPSGETGTFRTWLRRR